MAALQNKVAGFRRFGAASLDLAFVAAGRLDGYWERNLSPWDIAAGQIMVREAGGIISDVGGKDDAREDRERGVRQRVRARRVGEDIGTARQVERRSKPLLSASPPKYRKQPHAQ
jgi:fructose-1,6-bisphosphatase/inositol monophosphatase family enzyme